MKKERLDVSVGVIAYNEEKNIAKLIERILEQKQNHIRIKEISIVSDGSTDRTNDIVGKYAQEDPRIRFIRFSARQGKYQGINAFLRESKEKILILLSADIMFQTDTLSRLCQPFLDSTVVMTIARPIPVNKGTLIDSCVRINWELHHRLAQIRPKGTEMMAFRRNEIQLPKTIVDEEYLLAMLSRQGTIVYAESVYFFNKGPTRISEFVTQIRRYYAGHRFLRRETGHHAITAKNSLCLLQSFLDLPRYGPALFVFLMIQLVGRSLGYLDFVTNRNNVLWKCATTTKDVYDQMHGLKQSLKTTKNM